MPTNRGLEIQIELKRRGLPQLWLLGELREKGFTTLDAPLLSRILTGRHPWKLAHEVIPAAEEILGINADAHSAAM